MTAFAVRWIDHDSDHDPFPIDRATPGTGWLASLVLLPILGVVHPTLAADASRAGLIDLGRTDSSLKGFAAPGGFRLQQVADEALIKGPSAMAFDDSGRLYVAESIPSDRTFDVWESVTIPDGTRVRLARRRKPTADQIKRLTDSDGDGRFDKAEIVVEGIEQPTSLLWLKNALYATALGRLERWNDADDDGRFETRTVLIDGFGAVDERGLSGLTWGADGYLYLTTGDNDDHAFSITGAPIERVGTGGLFRCRVDGSELKLLASGFRRPRGNVAFDANFQPILIDDDGHDGSKVAGVRLIQPVEQGDYGWRLLPGPSAVADHDLGTVHGDRSGKLAGFARLTGSAPSSLVVYGGTLLPDACRGLLIATDPARHSVRGFKLTEEGGVPSLVGETTLLVGDDRFHPEQILVGADSALYLLDRGESGDKTPKPGGRIYRLTYAAAVPPAPVATQPINWDRIKAMTTEQLLLGALANPDHEAAQRALREVIDRGAASRSTLLTLAANTTLPNHVRLLGIQGARQFWNDEVMEHMANLLLDSKPEVRRLAAQTLHWEPRTVIARLVPKLQERLVDSDPRVLRELALTLGRHGQANPMVIAPVLVRWLYAHPQVDAVTRDSILRALEQMPPVGVAEVALAARTRRGVEREDAVRLFVALRSAAAAEELSGLIKIPDLPGADRAALIRQLADFPPEVPVSTTALVDWMLKHPEVEPVVKLAALETCRLVGNPASALIVALLDDDDEAVRITAATLAGRTRPPGAMTRLAARLGDETLSVAERLAIVRSLREAGPSIFNAIDAAYIGSESPDFRRAALRSMADADRNRASAALLAALAGPDVATRLDAVAILGETPGGAVAVGKAYLDRTLGRSDLPAVLAAFRPYEGADVRSVLAAVQRDAATGATALTASAVRLRAVEAGNPWSGMNLFFGRARCSTCHQVGGQGEEAGSPLDLADHGSTAEKLVEAIRHPARSGSEPARLAMSNPKDSGKLAAPLAGVDRTRRDGDDREHRAVMPSGLDLELTPRELADLVAFLLDAPAQAAVKQGGELAVAHWLVAGPFAMGADSLRVPLDHVDPTRSLPGQGGQDLLWEPLTADDSGRIDLGGLFTAQPGHAFAVTQVQTDTAQTAWLSVSTRGAARVYLDGTKVDEAIDRSATLGDAATTGPIATVRLPLKVGANLLVVAFDSPSIGEPIATFRLASPQPVEIQVPKN